MVGDMTDLSGFLKTTVFGGIVFLIPIVVIALIIDKVFEVMKKVADPLADIFPIHGLPEIILANIIAIALVILVCFLAGLAAKSTLARRLVTTLDSTLQSNIPFYFLIKRIAADIVPGADGTIAVNSVMVQFDDFSQVAFEIERLDQGKVVVFLPNAPNPWSGRLIIVNEERIEQIDATMVGTNQIIRQYGKGTNEFLRAASGPT